MTKIEMGRRIREARLNKGLTMSKLAKDAGTSIVYIGEIERGLKMPSVNTLIKIANVLEVSIDYILRYEVKSGEKYVYDEFTSKLDTLSKEQKQTVMSILDAYINNL